MRGMRANLLVGAALAFAGCVLPKLEVSGAEMSWYALEHNSVDGDDARRIRSCRGSLITSVAFIIRDLDDDHRRKRFSWPCEEGFRTPAQFFTGASDVFIDLGAGSYGTTAISLDEPALRGSQGEPMAVAEDEQIVAIGSEDATLIQWELDPTPLDLQLDITGAAACQDLTATLVYRDPSATLPDLEGEPEQPLVYREMLRSQGGLWLGGLATPCAQLTDGSDLVLGVDRGIYTLTLRVDDGESCAIDLVVDGRQDPLVLDLADLPC